MSANCCARRSTRASPCSASASAGRCSHAHSAPRRIRPSGWRRAGFPSRQRLRPPAIACWPICGEPVGVYQWHLDVFDLPQGSVRLARSDLSENQAFRYGDRWWGLQFHPEVDAPLFAGWMKNYADAPARNGIDRGELEAAIAAGSPGFTEPLFSAFCAVCADIAR